MVVIQFNTDAPNLHFVHLFFIVPVV